jgi:superfamily II DNA or RNA helicase
VSNDLVLKFKRGRIWVEGEPVYLNGIRGSTDFPAHRYHELISHIQNQKIRYQDKALIKQNIPKITTNLKLRDYQEEALQKLYDQGSRGTIILPTGAGKTIVALKAIEKLNVSTLIVVPTLVLVDQWKDVLKKAFKIKIGTLGGGEKDIQPITVSTYDSASLQARNLGNLFEFIIFDEVHHLPAPSYIKIATRYLAPYRLGLTATLSEDKSLIKLMEELIGKTVYRMDVEDLAGTHLAEFKVQTVRLPLNPKEKTEYDHLFNIYRKYLSRKNIKIRSAKDYLRFVQMSGRNPEARRALLARNRAVDIAMNSSSKIMYLKNLLTTRAEEKTLIFTRHNKLVYKLSKNLLIPAITHQTPKQERTEILQRFHKGQYMRILTSRVLDEGVDVPDASIGVIISGSGSNRQFIQRLGRLLRKTPGKQATLYELVSAGTAETRTSARRKQP